MDLTKETERIGNVLAEAANDNLGGVYEHESQYYPHDEFAESEVKLTGEWVEVGPIIGAIRDEPHWTIYSIAHSLDKLTVTLNYHEETTGRIFSESV